jgi:pyruvate ferredoxin oxidoreductase alpha subunit
VQEYIFGLGGRDFYPEDAEAVLTRLMEGDYTNGARFIGLEEGDE